ncbi:MAG: trypsin-like peptidase domain-containing protein [Oscillospiraceae bacterium]|jgi:serine protease Do|nr:trypsin-like peptidase domain-containing protein [Oscillospiraceae bacterium]
MDREFFRKNWAGVLALALTGLMCVGTYAARLAAGAPRQGIAFAEDTAAAEDLSSPFKGVYAAVSPSVVGIQVTTAQSVQAGRIVSATSYAGSGVVISEDGYILTNQHVVAGAQSVYVIADEKSIPATYVAGDVDSDVAVLKVDPGALPAAKLGDSDALAVGDWALVIGNPLGEQFEKTLTIGVVSGVGRDVLADNGRGGTTGSANMIQTNAAINAGNSGGGLFNIAGELVGITSMKLSNNGYSGYASIEGIGLAIPINSAKTIVNDLIVYGKVRYPQIGISMQDITSPSMEATSEMLPQSIWVTAVAEDGPAARAGMRMDDLILEVDGTRVTTAYEVRSLIRAHAEGETVRVTVYRIPGLTELRVSDAIPEGETITLSIQVVLQQ